MQLGVGFGRFLTKWHMEYLFEREAKRCDIFFADKG